MEANQKSTRIGNFRTFSTIREIDANPNSTDSALVRLVGSNRRVLELGCGSGHMSRVLQSHGCTVVGIEINPDAAKQAAAFCDKVVVGDLDYMDFDEELGGDRYDVGGAADVLEHLKDPVSVLQSIKKFLTVTGYVVISIPNVAHLSVRLSLLSGRFPYGETGLLDKTHLRFFTKDSAEKLLEDAGFAMGHLQRIENIPLDSTKFEVPYDLTTVPAAVRELLESDPDASTYQFVFVAFPLQAGMVFLQERMKQLANEAEVARHEASRVKEHLEEAERRYQAAQVAQAAQEAEVAQVHRQEVETMQSHLNLLREHLTAAESAKIDAEAVSAKMVQECSVLQADADRLRASLEETSKTVDVLRSESSYKQEMIDEFLRLTLTGQHEQSELTKTVHQSQKRIADLEANVEILLAREKTLRDMLLDAHDQLLRRDEEIAVTLAASLPHSTVSSGNTATSAPPLPGKYLQYEQLVHRIRELVRGAVRDPATVLVISKGDNELVKMHPCKGEHFPQRPDGVYAGYYPANGGAAVQHLKELRQRGARFLLIPQTSLWWLDHYAEFADFLKGHCTRVIDQPEVCVMFELAPGDSREIEAAPSSDIKKVVETPRPFGVNLSGNITSEKGVGEAVRSQIRSLGAAGVPLVLNNFLDDSAVNPDKEFTNFSEQNPFAVNLVHVNADSLAHFVERKTKRYFEDRYNIGFWAWETPVFPRQWWDRFQHLDEIWVGSDFVLDAVSRVSPIPVVKVPLPIPDRLIESKPDRARFGLAGNTFVFLFVFDYMSVFQRKNPLALIEAFRKAFSARDNAILVLKSDHSERHPADATTLKRACNGANVKVIDSVLSRQELNSLMACADCYVSLHRSEGFGLTMAEAMSLQKPVIATGFSGNMEFMTPANSYLVKSRLVDIQGEYGPYREGFWADPDVEHAAELMRFVFKNRAAAAAIGRRARHDVLQTLSHERVGHLMKERLCRLAERGRIALPAEEVKTSKPKSSQNGFYGHLCSRIREIVHTHIPADRCVLVVSKGDDNLVSFGGPKGWHFPQTSDGTYAGHYPANSSEAIGHLESLRTKGAEYLLFPQTAFWWLDHYGDLRTHLESRYRRVWRDQECLIYQLNEERNTTVLGRLRERFMTTSGVSRLN